MRTSVDNLQSCLGSLIARGKLRGWMYYSLRHCLYSKTASSDLSTVLPLTETSGGKPPRLAHSAHVLLSRAEQLKAAPSFSVSPALPNEVWLEVSSPLQPGPHKRSSRKILKQSRTLICCWSAFVAMSLVCLSLQIQTGRWLWLWIQTNARCRIATVVTMVSQNNLLVIFCIFLLLCL